MTSSELVLFLPRVEKLGSSNLVDQMSYQVKFSMHPDGPYVEREEATLIQQYINGQIKADTMVRRQEWDTWLPIARVLNLPPQKSTNQKGEDFHLNCAKCSAEMHEGYIVELAHENRSTVSRWISGAPENSFWWGLTFKGKRQYAVQTFRCQACGYLESYARERLTE